jgi:hypothetical protein
LWPRPRSRSTSKFPAASQTDLMRLARTGPIDVPNGAQSCPQAPPRKLIGEPRSFSRKLPVGKQSNRQMTIVTSRARFCQSRDRSTREHPGSTAMLQSQLARPEQLKDDFDGRGSNHPQSTLSTWSRIHIWPACSRSLLPLISSIRARRRRAIKRMCQHWKKSTVVAHVLRLTPAHGPLISWSRR